MTSSNSDPQIPEPELDLSFAEFERKLADPRVTIANALSRQQFAEGHIPGTIALPLDELPDRAAELLPDRSQEIVFYCGGPP
ncbi:MAG: rhodanese-like domain-containing protein [Cyanobacteria bacterium REEB65]|nr:rhodanese-like domain-containing protein [Cyanobacteria bacterium REEB65]